MGSRATTVIDLLEREWEQLEGAPASAHQLRRLADNEPALAPFATLAPLRKFVEDRATSPEHRDQVLIALVRKAAGDKGDDLAARTVLQLLLPGCKALVRRYCWTDSPDEVAAAVVAEAYERIRTYPVDRRPTRVAANILLDVKQRVFWRRRAPVGEVGHDLSAAAMPMRDETATAELLDLLSWAVAHGHLTRDAASLIAQTRVADVTIAELCARHGSEPQTMRRRRQRAERRLKAAATAAA
jgi:hypothetical protein